MRRAQRPRRGLNPGWLVLLVASLAAPSWAVPSEPKTPGDTAELKIYVAEPGVYAVPFEAIQKVFEAPVSTSAEALELSHRGRPVRLWIEGGEPGRFGPGDRLRFVAPSRLFQYRPRDDASPLAVLLLDVDGVSHRPPSLNLEQPPDQPPDPDGGPWPQARPIRSLRFEQDRVRAPLTSRDAQVDSMWFWTSVSQLASAEQRIELGSLADLREGGELRIRIRALGWSRALETGGLPQHRLDVFLNGTPIGGGSWDGRRIHEIEITGVDRSLLGAANELTLKVPSRKPEGSESELVDVSYVDWVELEYSADPESIRAGSGPILLDASEQPRWLPGAPGSRRPVTGDGRPLRHHRGYGWLAPASSERLEIWAAEPGDLLSPVGLEAVTAGIKEIPSSTEYLVIAGPFLLDGSRRLAELHRRRGLRTYVVDVRAVYDAFDHGYRSAAAIRRFLLWQSRRDAALRYVLLVGDADWLTADDRLPYGHGTPVRRNRIPTWTHLSDYGPGASDHGYAADPEDEASPLFAVGRLPAADADELRPAVDKIARHLESAAPCSKPTILLTSDRSGASESRRWRLLQRLDALDVRIETPETAVDRPADVALVEALRRSPDIVHFDGHGGRHMWQLGGPLEFERDLFFEFDDLELLEQTAERLPVMLAVSCATAPFDHPSSGSLGEALVLGPGRGAVAYIGASVRLVNPPRVSPLFVEALVEEETLGDALVSAKRRIGLTSISSLYNLIGDPALPLSHRSSCP